jgi:hypothetical protein
MLFKNSWFLPFMDFPDLHWGNTIRDPLVIVSGVMSH